MRRVGSLLFLLVAVCGFFQHSGVYAQSAGVDNNRKRAFELFKQDKHLEALPLFEELALKSPDDRDVLLGLGVLPGIRSCNARRSGHRQQRTRSRAAGAAES